MMTREMLSAEHDELASLAEQLLAAIADPDISASELASIRWRLHRVLMLHLAKEDQLLYPRLKTCGNPRTEALATRFADEMGGLAAAYLAYSSKWTGDRIVEAWNEFGHDTRKIIRALRHRIVREERDLYPLFSDDQRKRSIA